MSREDSEEWLIEKPTITLFEELGWESADCFSEFENGKSFLGRETTSDVILVSRLRSTIENLNPGLPPESYQQAIEELIRDRSAMLPVSANQVVYKLIKNGIKVRVPDKDGYGDTIETLKIIDWNNPDNNDYFLASQLWVSGEMHKRRPDLVGFVNGIPLVLIELKASDKPVKNAYIDNLRDYRDTIPQIFWYNSIIILSNGKESKVGSITSEWEHFSDWPKINSEGEEGIISLETLVRGTCEKTRLLDIIENFTLFMEARGGLLKLISKNHQFLGVTNAIDALKKIEEKKGRLGVFWHTQGSGKSVSMIFFAQKILRKIPGNWTFVIVTDRKELDDQIYKNFANCSVVTKKEIHAESSKHLRQLLTEDHRYVFTLIHKFRTENEKKHPVLSNRSDIIVITDEAHRSQYDTLAYNMRTALPNASFIAFTGTPLIIGEEKTKKIFGDYVSVYNFKQSIDDKATVPLYYENRIPEVELKNEDLNEEIYRVIEDAELDEDQENKLEREFARQYHIITREDRLDTIAKDIVSHFVGRGFLGKGMVISIDKATTIRMYDKVKEHWGIYIQALENELKSAVGPEKEEIKSQIEFMKETDMAVVVSQSQNEIDDMKQKGLDIAPHRKRMLDEDLETKFKDPNSPFRLVFVCAMWMTGFDVPNCSTIYLDKPMKNHTLMQTIARANRVFPEKNNGLIVDYVGVFRNLQKALAIYGPGSGGSVGSGDTPVLDKSLLVKELKKAIDETLEFCGNLGEIQSSEGFERVKLKDDAVNIIISKDEIRKDFLVLSGNVNLLFKAVLPDKIASVVSPICILINKIASEIRALTPPADISSVMGGIEQVLDQSISSKGYVIREPTAPYGKKIIDLSELDFEELRKMFEKGKKNINAQKLRNSIKSKLNRMVQLNRHRMDYRNRFEKLIADYNAGSMNVEELFNELLKFLKDLNNEEKRGIREGLDDEELSIFDILTKPDIRLTAKEKGEVKKVAKELLVTLKREKLGLDWKKRQTDRASVKVTIKDVLDKLPEEPYPELIYNKKCGLVYEHIYDSYFGAGKSIYSAEI